MAMAAGYTLVAADREDFPAAPVGSDGGPCTLGGQCDPGLVCVEERCLRKAGKSLPDPADEGAQEGAPKGGVNEGAAEFEPGEAANEEPPNEGGDERAGEGATLAADPLFFNASTGDLRLREGSPGIDSGSLPCDREPLCAGQDSCEPDRGYYAGSEDAECLPP